MNRIDELFNIFHEVSQNPRQKLDEYLQDGKKVVLCTPIYTPEELVHSLGMVPMGAWGADIKLEESKKYFPTFICSVMQSIVELGKNGKYNGVSAVMIPSFCDSMQAMGENWKYAVPNIPIISCDFPQNRKISCGFEYVKSVYLKHITKLEYISGNKFELEKLNNTNEIYDRHNMLMRKFSDSVAIHPSILPSQRSDVYKSALFMLKEEHSILLEELLLEMDKLDDINLDCEKIRLVTTGIQMDMPGILKVFDDNNIQIVADDIAQESRQYITDTADMEDPLDALSGKFCNRDYCSLLYDIDKKRLYKLVDTVREKNAKGIVYVQTKFCDPEEFDYVAMKELCDKNNIPLVMIEIDRQMDHFEQVNTAIQTFTEILTI